MDSPNPEHPVERIKAALFSGDTILAIQLYREKTGLGLAEAKKAVEKLEAELRAVAPESFTKPAVSKGCAVHLWALAWLGVAAAGLFWVKSG